MAILSTPSRLSEPHGQALIAAFRAEAIPDRQIDELKSLCNGVLAEKSAG